MGIGVKPEADFNNLSPTTLSVLNSKITDATLLDTTAIQFKTGSLHAASDHQNGGSLEISAAGLSGELADAQKTAISKNSGAIVGTRKKLNLIEGSNVTLTVADDAGNDEVDITVRAFPQYPFWPESFFNPSDSAYPVTLTADLWRPTSNTELLSRSFDDTDVEGVGFSLSIPSGATNIIFDFTSFAAVAPATPKMVIPKLYTKTYADNTADGSWDSGTLLTAIDIPASTNKQYDSQTIALSTLSLTAGNFVQFELVRSNTGTLVWDWYLTFLMVRFS